MALQLDPNQSGLQDYTDEEVAEDFEFEIQLELVRFGHRLVSREDQIASRVLPRLPSRGDIDTRERLFLGRSPEVDLLKRRYRLNARRHRLDTAPGVIVTIEFSMRFVKPFAISIRNGNFKRLPYIPQVDPPFKVCRG